MNTIQTVCARTFLFASLLMGAGAPVLCQGPPAGIGVQVAADVTGAKIVAVSVGSPAERAGLHAGDVILTVNNAPLHGLQVGEMVDKLRGELGTTVRLVVMGADGNGRTAQVVRAMPIPAAQQLPPPAAAAQASPPPTGAAGQASGATAQAGPGAAGDPSFASWTEPKEHAFTVDVPRGWQVAGGVSWHSQTDAQQFIRVTSPDGKVQIFLGDPDLLARMVPNQMQRTYQGAREGQQFQIPTGGTALWLRYQTGSQAAQQHLEWRRLCQNPRTVWSGDRRDESATLTASLVDYGRAYNAKVIASAGDIGFICDGAQGYVYAATVLATATNNAIQAWGILKLAGFVSTDPMQSMRARIITEHMMATMKSDPAWDRALEDKNRRITGAYMSMQNAAVEVQLKAARSASDDLARLNHPNAGVNVRPGETRSSSTNTILGTRDVCDAIGRCKVVSNDADSYFMDHSGNVRAGLAGGAPPDNSGVWSPTYGRP